MFIGSEKRQPQLRGCSITARDQHFGEVRVDAVGVRGLPGKV